MSNGITNPDEVYFKGGLWGWLTDHWVQLVTTAARELRINISSQDVDVNVTQDTLGQLISGVAGWDGIEWRKLPILWGYSEGYLEKKEILSASEGANYINFSIVPAGEVWVVKSVNSLDLTSEVSAIAYTIYNTTATFYFYRQKNVSANTHVPLQCDLVLSAGDRIRVIMGGVTAGDHLQGFVTGYKMKVNQ